MHFLLAPFGTAGDIYPNVGIGLELQRRGHRATVITHSPFRDVVERFGLGYVDLNDAEGYQGLIRHPDHVKPMAALKLEADFILRDTMRKQFAAVAKLYSPGQTVVVANHAGYGVRIAHDKLGIPMVSAVVAPFMIRSEARPAVQPVADWLRQASPFPFQRRALSWIADRFFADPLLAPEINRFRAELGLPPVSRVLYRWLYSPQCILGLFPRWNAEPVPEDWPVQVRFGGFPFFDDVEGPLPEEAERFLSDGPPPVVFTPGTGVSNLRSFFETAVNACRRVGCRAVLLTRFREQVPDVLPDGVCHFAYLPLSRLLPRSAVLVSHGGVGTMAQALRAGIPQLMMPINYDQPDQARRALRRGLGRVLPRRAFRTPAVVRELKLLLADETIRDNCRAAAAEMKDENPFDATCDCLEDFARQHTRRAAQAA